MTKIKLIESSDELLKAIASWGTRGAKWAAEGHMLALSALTLLAAHGDVGPVNRLYLAMPKGTKSSAMAEWLLTFGRVVPTEDSDVAKTKPFTYSKDKVTDLEAAAKKPWFEFKPEPAVLECFDVQAAVVAFIKATEAKIAKAQTSTHTELLTGLQALVVVDSAMADADPLEGVKA